MKKINFNKDWRFAFEKELDEYTMFGHEKYSDAAGAAGRFYDNSNWRKVDLPHDWALLLERTPEANTFAGAYPTSHYHRFMAERHSNLKDIYNIGWYRKQFELDPQWQGKRIFIEFEGVFRDAMVCVNGVYLDRHTSGYTSFVLELTDHLVWGEGNSVAVRVNSDQVEGWWYEGAGIYRNVFLHIGEPAYFKYNKTLVRPQIDGSIYAAAVLVNDTNQTKKQEILWRVLDARGREVAKTQTVAQLTPYGEIQLEANMQLTEPHLWDLNDPYLYTLEIQAGEEKTQTTFGIRSVLCDPDRGFFLNGKPLKIRGACVHQDFGGVGIGLTDNLNEYKIKRLKDMGVNAYRCAHHAPAPALLDACDRLGMLVMNETRTFGTSPEAHRQLVDLMERDRNHPSVFIWSLGNEEFSVQDFPWSFRLMEKMTRWAKELDPTRPVIYGGNNGPDFTGANGASEVRGVNYIRNGGASGAWLDQYHAEHPHQPIMGTEEASYVLSRGGAVNDLGNGQLDSTGSVTMDWGSTLKGWVKFMEQKDYFGGTFMWTGFDYRGEPNPFYYANASTSFGAIDLCGMEKPVFYYYKAWWTDEPVLKLAPHWNHKEGDTVTVAVFTNCSAITLYINGREVETRQVERFDSPQFRVAYEPGVLSVKGVRDGVEVYDELVTAGETATITCAKVLDAKTEADVAIYEINAYDEKGNFCPLAADRLEITADNGQLVGVGNGDPASFAPEYYAPQEECMPVRSFVCEDKVYAVPAKAPNAVPRRYDWIAREEKTEGYEDDYRLLATYNYGPKEKEPTVYTAKLYNAEDYEYVEFERLGRVTEVYLNGEKIGDNIRKHGRHTRNTIRPYRFYAKFKEGENELKVVSQGLENDPPAMSGYVKLGKEVVKPWKVSLHYGKARVFVKSPTPDAVKLTVTMKK